MKRWTRLSTGALAVGLALLGGGPALMPPPAVAQAPATPAQAGPIVWNLPHVAAPSHYHIVNLTAFTAKVNEKAQGRLEIRIHPTGSLVSGGELLPALLEGRVEIAPVVSTALTDVMPELGVLELPFMTGSLEEHRKAAERLRGFTSITMSKKGLRLLTVHAWPSTQLLSTQPIRTIADWKGKKVRVYGPETADFVRAVAGAPHTIGFGDLHGALQRRTIDAAMTSATNAEPMKFHEVAKFLNYWHLTGASLEWLAVNQKAWESLPADLQRVVLTSLRELRFEDRQWEDTKASEDRARKRAQELGMTVVEVSPAEITRARTQAKAAWDAWLRRTGEEGERAMEFALKALGRAQ